jgi:hypothetical protein
MRSHSEKLASGYFPIFVAFFAHARTPSFNANHLLRPKATLCVKRLQGDMAPKINRASCERSASLTAEALSSEPLHK